MKWSVCVKPGVLALTLLSLLACRQQEPTNSGKTPYSKTPAASSAAQAKIAVSIRTVCTRMAEQGVSAENAAQHDPAQRFSSPALSVDTNARLQVYVGLTAVNDSALQTLKDHGFQVEIANDALRLVQGWGACDTLSRLADMATVEQIRPPDYAAGQ